MTDNKNVWFAVTVCFGVFIIWFGVFGATITIPITDLVGLATAMLIGLIATGIFLLVSVVVFTAVYPPTLLKKSREIHVTKGERRNGTLVKYIGEGESEGDWEWEDVEDDSGYIDEDQIID